MRVHYTNAAEHAACRTPKTYTAWIDAADAEQTKDPRKVTCKRCKAIAADALFQAALTQRAV